jgi:hypothetical protein
MSIKITTKKVLKNGKKYREILNIQAIRYSKLPDMYTGHFPHCFLLDSSNTFIIEVDWTTRYAFSVGDTHVDEEYFQECLRIIRKCGKRLMKINQQNWSGEEVITI